MRIKTLSVEQARRLDARAQTEIGLPALILMENAGIALSKVIRQTLIPPIDKCRIVMVCGAGNNGGDAFVAARHLAQNGYVSELFLVGNEAAMKEETAVNYRIIRQLKFSCEPIEKFEARRQAWDRLPVVVVDALIGTGFKSPMRENVKYAVMLMNRFKKTHNCSVKIVAVDMPSGLDGDKGPVESEIVKADVTVTFACIKQALSKPESRPFAGRVEVVDIGIPDSLYQEVS